MEIFQVFTFDAAHKLPNVPPEHKCARLHGHTFKVEIHIVGEIRQRSGWVVDFEEIKKAFAPLLRHIDHNYLNDVKGLENPTSENIARWIWVRLKPRLSSLSKVVVVQESSGGTAIYRGEKK